MFGNDIPCYGLGNLIRLSVQFNTLVGSTPIDPTTVTLYIRNPDQSIDTFTYADSQIIRTGVGAYYYNLSNTQAGYYNYRFEGGGNCTVAQNGQFNSVPSPFGSL